MKNIFTNPGMESVIVRAASLKVPVLAGLVIVLPLVILELVNRQSFGEGFPIVLFGLIWLLPTIFIAILMPIVRNARAGNNIFSNPLGLLFSVVFMALIVLMWTGILVDQMPCFLGVPNCD